MASNNAHDYMTPEYKSLLMTLEMLILGQSRIIDQALKLATGA